MNLVDRLDVSIEDALGEDSLGLLATHISIGCLLGDKHTTEFALCSVHLVDSKLNVTAKNVELFVVLVEEEGVTVDTVLDTGEGASLVVTSGGTTALGIKEEAGAVGRNDNRTSHLEARLDLVAVALGNQALEGEEERNTLAAGHLHSGGSVVDTIFLGEGCLAVLDLHAAGDVVKGVGLAGHELGGDELLDGLTLLGGDKLLHLPVLALYAEVGDLVLAATGEADGVLSNHLGASVSEASSLDLAVGKAGDFGLGEGLGRHGNAVGSEDGGNASSHGLVDGGHSCFHCVL